MCLCTRAVILTDVLVKCRTAMAFGVNVTTVADAIAATVAAVMAFASDPCTVQMKIHFRTVAWPPNVYLGHVHLLIAAGDAAAAAADAVTTTIVARPVSCRTIQTIYRGSGCSDFAIALKYFECLF